MIFRIITALAVVIGVYYAPSIYGGDYTTLPTLRENVFYHASVISLFLIFVRGWTCLFVCLIEIALIGVSFHLAANWHLRDIIFTGIHYATLQDAGFYSELAIICTTIIARLREIGADVYSIRNRDNSRAFNPGGGKSRL